MNTGYLCFYAHESAYNRYRRFLVANGGRPFSLKELKNICRDRSIETDTYHVTRFHFSAFLVNEIVVRELKTTRAIHVELLEPTKKGYRPSKHCPKCSKIGYHSRLFDLNWLRVCPFHMTDLTDHCVYCGDKWPSIAQLSKTKCTVCGVSGDTDSLIRNGFYDEQKLSRAFEELHQLSSLLESKTPELKTVTDYRRSMWQREVPPAINNFNIAISGSALKQLNILNLAKANILKRNGVPRLELNVLTIDKDAFNRPPNLWREYDYGELIPFAVNELSRELFQLENTKCSCKNKEESCAFCISWSTWLIFLGLSNSLDKVVDYVNSSINRQEIFSYCRNLGLPRPYLFFTGDCLHLHVPRDLSEILFIEDLKNLYFHIFSYVYFVRWLVKEDPGISTYDVEEIILKTFFSPNLSATLPIRAGRLNGHFEVFWPRVNLASDLSWLQKAIDDASCIYDIMKALSKRW